MLLLPVTAKWHEYNSKHNRSTTNMSRWEAVRQFLYGMMGMEIANHAIEMRASLESLFMLGTVGDMVGVPILPPYYSLRLLPYVIPQIETWKRRVLREREFSDVHEYDLDGL